MRVRWFLLGLACVTGCDDCFKPPPGNLTVDAGASPSASQSAVPVTNTDGGVMNATPWKLPEIEAMVNPEKLPPYKGPTGSIEGTVVVTGDPAPPPRIEHDFSRCPDASKTWGKNFREYAVGGGARALADAIVVVTGYKGYFVPERREVKQIRIEDCAYTTRTATMTFGQRLEVKNDTKEFWSPTLAPGNDMVLMMAAPKGDPVKLYPRKPGHYLLMDRDRKYAVVDVYAFLHPLHASTDTAGHYRIDGLPIGKLKVSTTHPQIEATDEKEIEIADGVVVKADLVLKNVNKDAGPLLEEDSGYHPKLR